MQEYYLNSEKKICLMELSEFKELEGAYPHCNLLEYLTQ